MIESRERHAVSLRTQLFVMALSAYLASPGAWGFAQHIAAHQEPTSQKALAPGDSLRVPDTDAVVTFEAVVEDSRCPRGAQCVWEGDAAIRIRIGVAGARGSTYTLHTSERLGRTIEHDQVRVEVRDLAPYPSAGQKTRPEDYRLTLQILRK